MGRPANSERFAKMANADHAFREQFEQLDKAILNWDRGGSFDAVLHAIKLIESECEIVRNWVPGDVEEDGAALMGELMTRLSNLSLAQAKLIETAGHVGGMKEVIREHFIASAVGQRARGETMPIYMTQLMRAILAKGIKQTDVVASTRGLAERIANEIREHNGKNGSRETPQMRDDEVRLSETATVIERQRQGHRPGDPLPSDKERMSLWNNMPRKLGDLEWQEVPKPDHFAPLPPFRTIEEFAVNGKWPGIYEDHASTCTAYSDHISSFKMIFGPKVWNGDFSSWAVMLAIERAMDSSAANYWTEFCSEIQSPWNDDYALVLSRAQ